MNTNNTELENVVIKVRLAMQLIGNDSGVLRELTLDSHIANFESGAVMVRELIKNLILEHAMERGRAIARMQATIDHDGFQYQINGLFNPKVGGLKLDVGFQKKADFRQALIDVWNEKIGGPATFRRIGQELADNRTLH